MFDSVESAVSFLLDWEGHPWYGVPDKNEYEVFEVEPIYKRVGWRRGE